MKLIFLRHATALERKIASKSGVTDFDRPLTAKGRREILKIGSFLKRIKEEPQLILSSPARRTVMTAQLLQKYFPQISVRFFPELGIDLSATKLVKTLSKKYKRFTCLVLVGHEPQLSTAASLLLGRNKKNNFISLKKCGLIVMEVRGKKAQLLYSLHPDLIL